MRARLQMRGSVIAYVVNGGLSTTRATDNVDRLIAEVRAAAFEEAADDLEAIDFHPNAKGSYSGAAKAFAVRLRAMADRPDAPTTPEET